MTMKIILVMKEAEDLVVEEEHAVTQKEKKTDLLRQVAIMDDRRIIMSRKMNHLRHLLADVDVDIVAKVGEDRGEEGEEVVRGIVIIVGNTPLLKLRVLLVLVLVLVLVLHLNRKIATRSVRIKLLLKE
jgi:hypothetical protein